MVSPPFSQFTALTALLSTFIPIPPKRIHCEGYRPL